MYELFIYFSENCNTVIKEGNLSSIFTSLDTGSVLFIMRYLDILRKSLGKLHIHKTSITMALFTPNIFKTYGEG